MRHGRSIAAILALLLAAPTISIDVAAQEPITIVVDANADRHQINPNIYGLSFASTAVLDDLNCPVNRSGGNRTSRYNWALNADNTASDWYFETWAYDDATPGALADAFVADTKAAGAEAMITVPMIGWVANVGPNRSRLSSFSVAKYGPQTDRDSDWFPDAGNGVSAATGQFVEGNDPSDASVASDPAFQRGFVQHLETRFGGAANGGLRYYVLDNEHGIWHETHRDVHPVGATLDEIRDKSIAYGTMIKSVDPSAVVVGPEEFGWTGYFLSGYDKQHGDTTGDWDNLPDRAAHNGVDAMPYFLDQMRRQHERTGSRVLDVFSLHFYPQAGQYDVGEPQPSVSPEMQRLRSRSTRSLWDPSYVDESWIGEPVRLIPRMKEWVNDYYPGTQTAITEYNFGAMQHINGATTQADVLGIFGREGLDLAIFYTDDALDPSLPVYKAFRLYRNYDGNRSTFGDTSVSATAPNPDEVSAFAAERSSDGALTVMVVCKSLSGTTPASIVVDNFGAGASAEVYQLTAANRITRLADAPVQGGTIAATLPAQSVTLFVIPAGGGGGQEASVAVSAPNGGERFRAGTTTTITWAASGDIVRQEIRLSADGGASFPTSIAANVNPAARSYAWTIPANLKGRRYRVAVFLTLEDGRTISDTSDGNFRIQRAR